MPSLKAYHLLSMTEVARTTLRLVPGPVVASGAFPCTTYRELGPFARPLFRVVDMWQPLMERTEGMCTHGDLSRRRL
eukprot:COSAG02_NODE_41716_length_391_cov_1.510274_2_plen_76_part_01